jgi:hypothetical protein
MTSPKAECEALLDMALDFAEQMLGKHGEFQPFGIVMKGTDEVTAVAPREGSERSSSSALIEVLKDSLRAGAERGEYRATAVVYNARIALPDAEEKSDAIAVSLDHRDHYTLLVAVPYQVDDGRVILGPTLAEKGEGDIFRQD